jgi:AcrR family transcriptional regulator
VNDVHSLNVVHESEGAVDEGGGRRARTRARRVDEIVAAALEMVRDEGIEALTTHALAKRLDVAVGALYRYFPSKAALLAEVERRAIGALGAHLQQTLDEAEGAFRAKGASLARLVLAGRAYARFAKEQPTETAFIGQILADPRTLVPGEEGAALVSTTLALLGVVAALFSAAADEGALSPGPSLERAVLYWSGLRAVLQLSKFKVYAPGFEVAPLADAMTRALLVGFGAEGDAVTRAFSAVKRYTDKDRAKESGT